MSRLSVLPPVFAYLTQLAVATKELLALIEGLEAFRGQQALSPETFDLNKFLRCFSHRLKHLLPGSIVVDLDLRAAFPQVNADPCRSQQVLMYLVDNASEAMPRGARLTIASGDTSVDDAHLCQRPNAMVGTHKPLRNGLGRSRTWGIVRQHYAHTHISSAPGQGTSARPHPLALTFHEQVCNIVFDRLAPGSIT
jgi:hypothetical protein